MEQLHRDVVEYALKSAGMADQYGIVMFGTGSFTISRKKRNDPKLQGLTIAIAQVDVLIGENTPEARWLSDSVIVEFKEGFAIVSGNVTIKVPLAQPDSIELMGVAIKKSMEKWEEESGDGPTFDAKAAAD